MKVRDIIKIIESDGWYLIYFKGSHRQFKHPTKPGRVTIAGHLNDNLVSGTFNSILKQAKLKRKFKMHQFLIVIEKAENNYSAYSPDLDGCIATGKTKEDVKKNMQHAIELHLKGLHEDKLPIPEPHSVAEYVSIK
jgi:predicted RNA binding protein YcfA (HicA-like mRNA interferase family)/predicted RNase H-like HicB family nuclease